MILIFKAPGTLRAIRGVSYVHNRQNEYAPMLGWWRRVGWYRGEPVQEGFGVSREYVARRYTDVCVVIGENIVWIRRDGEFVRTTSHIREKDAD